MTRWRSLWLVTHRWVGLLLAAPLLLAGITGAVLAFHPELERALNPQRYAAPSSAPRLGIAALAQHAEMAFPALRVTAVHLEGNQGATYVMVAARTDPRTGRASPLDFNQVFLDPYTGAVLDRTQAGAITSGADNLMGFIYKFHYTLALETTGVWIMGICATAWTLDCFIALVLTLPPRRRVARHRGAHLDNGTDAPCVPRSTSDHQRARTFFARWTPAWKVKWRASRHRINFDLHRAGGLWLWAMLLVFAWSSVYMNLWDTVYTGVTRLVFDYHAPWTDIPHVKTDRKLPQLSLQQAHAIAQDAMDTQARLHEFRIIHPVSMKLDRSHGIYLYRVRSDRDLQDRRGRTDLAIDADTGAVRLLSIPTGQHNGNTVTNWLYALHMGNVFGLPYRIMVCLFGLLTVILCVTGFIIWRAKSQVRQALRGRKSSAAESQSRSPRWLPRKT